MNKNYQIAPLFIIFIISVSINVFIIKSDVVKDDTVFKILSEKVLNYLYSNKFFLEKPNDFNNFYLLFDEVKLNTNNFINMFINKDIDVKKIYPYINPLYEDKLKNYVDEITFINNDLESGLNSMIEQHINILNDYGLDEEINKINIYGINIRVVLVNTSNEVMYDFLNDNKNVKCSTKLEGTYYKVK